VLSGLSFPGMTAVRVTACVLIGVLAAGCSGGTSANPLQPDIYLKRALGLIRSNAVYRPKAGWQAVDTEATRMAASAKTAADTYPAIEYAIEQLQQAGDLHAVFTSAVSERIEQKLDSAPQKTAPPTVSSAAPHIGLINLPPIGSLPNTPDGRHYAATALASIASLQRRQRPCGWIVDLRGNVGGDMYPMLLSIGPILGSGRLIGFFGTNKVPVWVSYRHSSLSGAGYTVRAPISIPDFIPAPAVALLTGSNTASAGEAVMIAFRGRLRTRSFGAKTAGATNSPDIYRLADGAAMRFSIEWDADRDGHIYRHAITPEVLVAEDFRRGDRPAAAATSWLKSTPACQRVR
jgi:carboxyl-terminal processing protease